MKEFFKTTYRGDVGLIRDSDSLRDDASNNGGWLTIMHNGYYAFRSQQIDPTRQRKAPGRIE